MGSVIDTSVYLAVTAALSRITAKAHNPQVHPMKLPRHAEIWLLPYLKYRLRKSMRPTKPRRAWVAITDHYEPLGRDNSVATALDRVARWRDRLPRIADDAPKDASGQRPQHSFFYPQEGYESELIEGISEMVRLGIGDVEVHIHHDEAHLPLDSERRDSFSNKMTEFCRRLTDDHGLLHQQDGRTVFGFIHGNWALDHSRPDGRCCGVKGEISLLRDLGCYADFTMPAIPEPPQGRIINQVYWCTNNPDNSPRSFDQGVEATVGGGRRGDLLMITGPVGVRLGGRLLPRIETGELAGYDMPTPARAKQWFDLAPTIGDDLFLKLYTHGAHETNLNPLLNGALANLYLWIAEEADRRGIEIHWASAWQMYKAADAIIHGRKPVSATVAVAAEIS